MKSKPVTKKAKLAAAAEAAAAAAAQSSGDTPSSVEGADEGTSSSSISSSASSATSPPPPQQHHGGGSSGGGGNAELMLAAAKAVMAGMVNSRGVPMATTTTAATGTGGGGGSSSSTGGGGVFLGSGGHLLRRNNNSAPIYPSYVHPDITEWPKLQVLINAPLKSAAGGSGSGGTSSSSGSATTLAGGGPGTPQPGAATTPAPLSLSFGTEGMMTIDDLDALQLELETLWSAMACRTRSLKLDQGALQNSSSSAASNIAASLGEHYDPHHQEKINAVASLIDAGHGTRTSVSAAAKLVMGAQQQQQQQQGTSAAATKTSSGVGSAASSPAPSPSPSTSVSGNKKVASPAAPAGKQDRQPKKKLKGEAGIVLKKGGEKPARATQNRSHSVSSELGGLDGFYKHEAPNEFWEFADKYCGEITAEHLSDLSKLIEDHRPLPESLFEIPPLGKYFKGEGEGNKKDEAKQSRRVDACGPLTQRLVASLVDERVAVYKSQRSHGPLSPRDKDDGAGSAAHSPGGSSTAAATPSTEVGGFIHRAGLIKALGLDGGPNRPPMELQLRECLLERGLLSPEDSCDPLLLSPDDEILAEIRRTQNTLRKLHDYNAEKLGELYAKAQKEVERSSLKIELERADNEVIESYRALVALKQKKKPITKKEKEATQKALDLRDKVLQKLNPGSSSSTTNNNSNNDGTGSGGGSSSGGGGNSATGSIKVDV